MHAHTCVHTIRHLGKKRKTRTRDRKHDFLIILSQVAGCIMSKNIYIFCFLIGYELAKIKFGFHRKLAISPLNIAQMLLPLCFWVKLFLLAIILLSNGEIELIFSRPS